MKIVLAFDKFKGSATSRQVAEAARRAILDWNPATQVLVVPMADGGEGTVEALAGALPNVHPATVETPGPMIDGEPVLAHYVIDAHSGTAVMEMSAACGLALVPVAQRNVMKASTWGVGMMVRDAIERGCHHIVMGLGGSATCDAGMGLLAALGFVFRDNQAHELMPCGDSLSRVSTIDGSGVPDEVRQCQFTLLCDVGNVLCGSQGAARVFAPQKGASALQVEQLERGLQHFATLLPQGVATQAGAGAAGGLAAGMLGLLHAHLAPGAEAILNLLHFDELIADARLVFTGEGCLDVSSTFGKTPTAVLARAHAQHIPVVAVCGALSPDFDVEALEFDAVFPVISSPMTVAEAMHTSTCLKNVEFTISQLLKIYSLKT